MSNIAATPTAAQSSSQGRASWPGHVIEVEKAFQNGGTLASRAFRGSRVAEVETVRCSKLGYAFAFKHCGMLGEHPLRVCSTPTETGGPM